MNSVWTVEWVCYPSFDGYEERYIEKVCNSKGKAIEWCNNDEDFEDNFLIIGEDRVEIFNRHREERIGHYEISCWEVY